MKKYTYGIEYEFADGYSDIEYFERKAEWNKKVKQLTKDNNCIKLMAQIIDEEYGDAKTTIIK